MDPSAAPAPPGDGSRQALAMPVEAVRNTSATRIRKAPRRATGDGKRSGKRGRPRVDPQDQSAVERRRTQIRLAQRAYRERKETSISALEQQVAELQQTISAMNSTFLSYQDQAMASGVISTFPVLGEHLKGTSAKLLELARNVDASTAVPTAEKEDEEGQEETKEKIQPPRPSVGSYHSADSTFGEVSERSNASSDPESGAAGVVPSVMAITPPEVPTAWEYPLSHGQDVASTVSFDQTALAPVATTLYDMPPATATTAWTTDPGLQYRVDYAPLDYLPTATSTLPKMAYPDPAADLKFKPVYTYNYHELSFGRRLIRAAYERMYHLLTNLLVPEDVIQRALRYTLCFDSRDEIVLHLRKVLKRSSSESLDNWNLPQQHVGGAGLHYDRTRLPGQHDLPSTWTNELSMGPFRAPKETVSVSPMGYPQNVIPYADVSGSWFDPYDVEEYLRAKGLDLDGSCFAAEIEVEETSSNSSPSAMEPSTDRTSESVSFGSGTTASHPSSPSYPHENHQQQHQQQHQPHQQHQQHPQATFASPPLDFLPPATDLALPPTMDFAAQYADMGFDFDFTNLQSTITPNKFHLHRPVHPLSGAYPGAEMSTPMESVAPGFPPSLPRKKKLYIDVGKFLNLLNEKVVCLGRAPGYKQTDVDHALHIVLQEASMESWAV